MSPRGYREIQDPPPRYRLIDLAELSTACGFANVREFQEAHRHWVESALSNGAPRRDGRWSAAIAVGSHAFVAAIKRQLGIAARHRAVAVATDMPTLREPQSRYGANFPAKTRRLRPEIRGF